MTNKSIFRVILNCLIFALSLIFWLFLENAFEEGTDWGARLIYPAASLLVLGMFLGIFILTETKKRYLAIAVALIIFSFLFVFSGEFFALSVGGLAGLAILLLAFIFLLIGALEARTEKNSRYKISAKSILKKGFGPMATAISLLTALIFFWSPVNDNINDREFLLPKPVFNKITGSFIETLGGGEINSKTAIGQKNLAAAQEQVYDSVNSQLNVLSAPYKKYFSAGLALTFFFTLKFLSFLLIWPMVFLGWLLFKILSAFGIIKINKVETEKEIIEI